MTCKYCKTYIQSAEKNIENFAAACAVLNLDPQKSADEETIVKSLSSIGQFGTIRLAREFPFVTDEEEFRMIADVALKFYWMILDFWEAKQAAEREAREAAELAKIKTRPRS